MSYKFEKQLLTGAAGEWVMDRYHAQNHSIEKATMDDERSGIDRFYTSLDTGNTFSVEIKTDFMSQKTGNLIWETVSNNATGTVGWAYKFSADILIYYRWYDGEIMYFYRDAVKKNLGTWVSIYPEVKIPNEGYQTIGHIVPVDVCRTAAAQTIQGIDPQWMKDNYEQWASLNRSKTYKVK